jgi:hypothetical protein
MYAGQPGFCLPDKDAERISLERDSRFVSYDRMVMELMVGRRDLHLNSRSEPQ